MNEDKPEIIQDAPEVKMLPPMMVLLMVAVGLVLDFLIPVDFGRWWGWIGLILFASAIGVAKWSIQCFNAAGTNVPPNKPTTVIVEDGPFQYSRNPIYLSFLAGYAGLGMMADAPIMMLLLIPLFFLLERKAILPEERYLSGKFGDVYLSYQRRVRRWL